MIRIGYIILFLFFSLLLFAQHSTHPRRTAEDIARKQTEMLVRELGITDSVLRDTLFRMHLKYANMRHDGFTRADVMDCMQRIQEELQQLLSPEQFATFMNRQLNPHPRTPQHPCNWIAPSPHHPQMPPSDEQFQPEGEPNMPPPPPEHQPQAHP